MGAALAGLLLGGNAEARTDVCYLGGPQLPNFKLNGSAALDGVDLVVNEALNDQRASIIYIPKFSASSDLHVKMQLKISQPTGSGADGMSFFMHADPRGAAALGDAGGAMGYGGANKLVPSVVVEMDTYNNGGDDPNNNHIGVMIDGDYATHAQKYTVPFDMRTASSFYLWVDYTAAMTKLEVYISDTATQPAMPQMTHTIDLAAKLGTNGFWMGFGGGTGGLAERNEVISFIASDAALTSAVCCTANADCAGSPLGSVCDSVKHVCGQCTPSNTAACAQATPGCDIGPPSNTCISACGSDFGSGMAGACVTSSASACVKAGAQAGACVACNGDYMSTASVPCVAGAPRCDMATGWCQVRCKADGDCGGATPACNTSLGVCQQCSATNSAQCTGATPVCDPSAGKCKQCSAANSSQCTGNTPACDTATYQCRACAADSECSAATPLCNKSTGACNECSATDRTHCGGATPFCDVSAGACSGCLSDSDCSGDTPACDLGSHKCVQCTAGNTSACTAAKPVCDTTTGDCSGCTSDTDCSGQDAAHKLCYPATGQCSQCTQTDVNQCTTGPKRCDLVNGFGVCAEPAVSGCACQVSSAAPTGDIAAVVMALALTLRRRRRQAA